jgi:hypothetical protein
LNHPSSIELSRNSGIFVKPMKLQKPNRSALELLAAAKQESTSQACRPAGMNNVRNPSGFNPVKKRPFQQHPRAILSG